VTAGLRKWLTVVMLVLLTAALLPQAAVAGESSPEILEEVRQLIKESYYRPVEDRVLQQDDVGEIFEALGDPYSGYFSPEEYEKFLHDTTASYGGVGMEVGIKDGYIVVISPFEGSPAKAAGIMPGDRIIAVDGVSTAGKSLELVTGWIKGEPGTKVTLTILREGYPRPFNVTVTREIIRLEVVFYRLVDGDIGYIRLTNFTPSAGELVEEALSELKQQGAKGIILDLRNNPGGYLVSALEVADLFVPEGKPIMYIRSRDGTVKLSAQKPAVKMPLVVLIDRGSASASEIVAAAIRDHGLGKLVGTATFGKGMVQSLINLESNPGAAVKITTAEYLSALGNKINGVGVEPDYDVDDPEMQLEVAKSVLREQIPRQTAGNLVLYLWPGRTAAYLNGKPVPAGGRPYLEDGSLMAPLRLIAGAFGGILSWDDTKREARLDLGDRSIFITVGAGRIIMGSEAIPLTAPAQMVNGRIYVPVRWLSHLDCVSVTWDGRDRKAVITRFGEGI